MAKLRETWRENWKTAEGVGGGGQGNALKARRKSEPADEGVFVIKTLNRPEDPERRSRLCGEVEALRMLEHPNIPRLIEANTEQVNEEDIALYMVSEFIPGLTLEKWVNLKGPMSFDQALVCTSSLVRTVTFFHDREIVHRDIKPDNIILRDNDPTEPVVLDFGLSFSTKEPRPLARTASSQQLGNRFLHLPELLTAVGNRKDHRSDLTQCCGILFHLLTGHWPVLLLDQDHRKPHERDHVRSFWNAIGQEPRQRLLRLMDKGFEFSPRYRFQRGEDLLVALNDVRGSSAETRKAEVSTTIARHPMALIQKKRDGYSLTADEIQEFVSGSINASWPDYQMAAMMMAILWRGMSHSETAHLTKYLAQSGATWDLSSIAGRKVSKHGTGGVGDKASLVAIPLAAACGATVPSMMGRGLGHVGGLLDKLECIPNLRLKLTEKEVRFGLSTRQATFTGLDANMAPMDRRLYALRDVTATVESIPLIVASIVSKQLACGVESLVFDVASGEGAFLKRPSEAEELAESLVGTSRMCGIQAVALVTAMDAPRGRVVGNALELREALETLQGCGPKDLETVSLALAAEMLAVCSLAASVAEGEERVREALATRRGFEKFREIVAGQGGDPTVIDEPDRLPRAPHVYRLNATRAGYVLEIHASLVGQAVTLLGGGRTRFDDVIDHSVGIIITTAIGERVEDGGTLAEVHYADEQKLNKALVHLRTAWVIGDHKPSPRPVILSRFEG